LTRLQPELAACGELSSRAGRCRRSRTLLGPGEQQITLALVGRESGGSLELGRRDGDRLRGSVVIDAALGLGKTTAAQRYARSFHLREYRRHGPTTEEGHQRLPVAWVPLTAGVTLKALNQKILAVLRPPRTPSGPPPRGWGRWQRTA